MKSLAILRLPCKARMQPPAVAAMICLCVEVASSAALERCVVMKVVARMHPAAPAAPAVAHIVARQDCLLLQMFFWEQRPVQGLFWEQRPPEDLSEQWYDGVMVHSGMKTG